ncbi:Uncharacterized protein APZ42_025383 [Daphnia magna]|uniref:Uncharacterized protein n=1 Tax=Daphnia magna TaxID=35525 RepID=A0A164T4Z6_9CRUS|nr:Uncharacterized protein APZ42_025383 [Daphnia magna]
MPRRQSVSSIGLSASDVTISTTLSQKRSTRSVPTDLPRPTSQLDLHIQVQQGECLANGTMYSVVWDGLDAVYGRTEVMDQTYFDDLLQIPPLKSQDAASLKTFANWFHGAVVALSQSRNVHELHSRTTMMAIEAKLTTYLVGARWVDTFGFLDTGSDTTLIRRDIVKKLGLFRQPKRINVVFYDGATSNVQAAVVDFSLSSVDGTSWFEVKHAYAVDNLKVTPNPPINPRQMESWTHLRGLDVPNVQPEDVPEERPEDLNELVKRFWQLEGKDVDMEQPVLSEDDLRGKRILESTVKNVGNRYQVDIMWKTDNVNLPDNGATALKRLYSLERRFQRDGDFAQEYDAVVKEYIGLDHARLLTTEELHSTTKVRVVFDGTAEYGGTSINQNLLRGPNLLASLFGLLLRFRRNLVPVGADIEKMFHQVKNPVEDQAAYHFVYRTPCSNQAPLTYRMAVHVFGSVSSPTTCIFALNQTADDHRDQYPEAVYSVRRNFYVDNYLDSFDSEDGAVKWARQMKKLLQLGGFNLKKWTSSSRKEISALREFGLASPTLNLDLEKLPIKRTLGVIILPCVYDPLGLIAPVVFPLKSLLQDIWKYEKRIRWDDPFPEELGQGFHYWYDHLEPLELLTVPRCFRHQRGRWTQHHLHDQSINVSFVMAKTHVTPVKGLTISRLKLQAAVEGFNIIMCSVNGTNLVAGEQELHQSLTELVNQHQELQSKMACQQIKWHFPPPHGPHFVTDWVLRTVIAEVAALLNARPLTNLSMDPDDPDPLTPNHFLHGGALPYVLLKLTDAEYLDVTAKQFLQSQAILQHFWNRWLREYVQHLTERRKWTENRPNVTIRDLVLVIEPNTLRGQWPLAKVIEVLPSESDNVVRVVTNEAPAGQRFAAIGVGLGPDYPRTILLPEDTGAKQKEKLKKPWCYTAMQQTVYRVASKFHQAQPSSIHATVVHNIEEITFYADTQVLGFVSYSEKRRMLRDANLRCQWSLPLLPDVRELKNPSMTEQRAFAVRGVWKTRQGRGGFSVGGSPSRQFLEDPELEWGPFLEEEEDMAECPMFHYKEPEKIGRHNRWSEEEEEEPKAACAVIGGDQTTGVTNGDRQRTDEILIGGRPVDTLVDTGAIISVISPSLASKLKLKIVSWEGPMFVTADGQPINPKEKVSLTVTNKNVSVEGEALVLKTFGPEFIMGRNLVKLFREQKICFSDPPIVELGAIHMEASNGNETVRKVTAMVRVTVLKSSAVPVKVSIPESGGNTTIMLLRPSNKLLQNSGLSAGHALIDCSKKDAVVHEMNVDHADHMIVEGTSIGQLVLIDQTSNLSLEVGEGRDAAGEVRGRSGKSREPAAFDQCVASTLAAQDRNDQIELLIEFQDVFAGNGDCLGQCTVLEHAIPTEGTVPIKQLPRRRACRERELIKDEVNKMLKQEVIEPAQCPWSSPIVLVKKKDGKWRFCIDYRRLNEVTMKDVNPLPRIDDALPKLEEAALFSVVYLQSGYWQVPVAEADKPKTAFVTPDGLYQFRVMPFGLCSAPGTFQRLIAMVLAGLKWTDCRVYMDDVVMFGKDAKEHLERLGKVLSCFRKANLKLKMEKMCLRGEKEQAVAIPVAAIGLDTWSWADGQDWEDLLYLRKIRFGLCVPPERWNEALSWIHDEPTAWHLGKTKTLERAWQRIYWPKMDSAVTRYVQSCKSCQTRKPDQGKKKRLMEITQVGGPFERIGIDVLGLFPRSRNGNTNIVVAVDYLTKWVESRALADAMARQIAKFFVEDVVVRHEFPRKLTSDQGKCFTAEVTREVLALLRLSHRMTVPYHLQANGLVERQKRHLVETVKSLKQKKLMEGFTGQSLERKVVESEIRLCTLIGEQNLPFSFVDPLVSVLKKSFPEDPALSKVPLGKQKCGSIIRGVGSYLGQTLKDRVKGKHLGVIIEETTDLSVQSQLGVVLQYFNIDEFRQSQELLDLTNCHDKSAEGLTKAITDLLKKHEIDKEMIVGFCADTTNSMFGSRHSVSKLLTDKIPQILCVKCSCHSIHLCSHYASLQLPKTIDDVVRGICTHFSRSPKRRELYAKFQLLMECEDHVFVSPGQTRWLTMEYAVNRVLEQYDALSQYFHEL